MSRSSSSVATGLAVGVAAAGILYAMRRRHEYLPRLKIYLGRAEGVRNEELEEGEDNCPICLDQPKMPCVTNCGHRFCAQCFDTWWKRQPVQRGVPHYMSLAKCPLCIQEVRFLRPGWRPARFRTTSPEEAQALSLLKLYNRDVYTVKFYRPLRSFLLHMRAAVNSIVLSMYGATSLFWGPLHSEMRSGGMFQIPRPHDERMRFLCLWGCITTACSTSVGGIRERQNVLVPWLTDVLVKMLVMLGDFRHAELDDVFIGSALLANLRFTSCLTTAFRMASMFSARYWQDSAVAPAMPYAMRACELVELAVDIAAAALQFRVEFLGVRALVLLMRWHQSQPVNQRVLDLLPIESIEAWLLPIDLRVRNWLNMDLEPPKCVVLLASKVGMREDVVAWADALRAYGVGLKALHVFHGLHPIVMRPGGRMDFHGLSRFPGWAVADVVALPPIGALIMGAGATAATRQA